MRNVLFLCTRNSARSQMAEAWTRHLSQGQLAAFSAGLSPSQIHPLTIQVMEEVGVSMAGARSKGVREFLGKVAIRHAIIVCADAEKNCPSLWPFCGDVKSWPFDDPVSFSGSDDEILEEFRRIRDEIRGRILNWLSEDDEDVA
jgi:arsenate reductase